VAAEGLSYDYGCRRRLVMNEEITKNDQATNEKKIEAEQGELSGSELDSISGGDAASGMPTGKQQ
jgi:hypothetical protein